MALRNYELHLNTRDLLSDGSSLSRWQVNLDAAIEGTNASYFEVQVSSFECPYTWLDWSATLNNTRLLLDDALVFTLDDGYYTADEMAEALTDAAGFPYTVTFNRRNGRFTLVNTDATEHIINAAASDYCRYLGFGTVDWTIAAGATVSAPYAFSTATVKALYLHASFPGDNAFQSTDGYVVRQAQILDKMSVDVNHGELICWGAYDSSTFAAHVHASAIKQFRIALVDQRGRDIDLQGQSCTITLQVDLMAGEATGEFGAVAHEQMVAGAPRKGRANPFAAQLAAQEDVPEEVDASGEYEAPEEPMPMLPPPPRPDDRTDLRLKAQALLLGAGSSK